MGCTTVVVGIVTILLKRNIEIEFHIAFLSVNTVLSKIIKLPTTTVLKPTFTSDFQAWWEGNRLAEIM